MPFCSLGVKGAHPTRPAEGTYNLYVLSTDDRIYLQSHDAEFDLVSASTTEVHLYAKKATVGTIAKGSAVYAKSWNLAGSYLEVEPAKADSATTMPCLGIAGEDIGATTLAKVVLIGEVTGLNTSSWAVKDCLYVSAATAGSLTNAKPQGATNLIQRVGSVIRVDGTQGIISVLGPGCPNSLPNLSNGKYWVGDASGVPQEVSVDYYGSEYDYQASEIRTTVTGLTWTTKVTIYIPANSTGKKYEFKYTCKIDANNKPAGIRLYNVTDAVTLDYSIETPSSAIQQIPIVAFVQVDGAAAQKQIDLQFHAETGGGDTIGIQQARVSRIRVS